MHVTNCGSVELQVFACVVRRLIDRRMQGQDPATLFCRFDPCLGHVPSKRTAHWQAPSSKLSSNLLGVCRRRLVTPCRYWGPKTDNMLAV